MQGPPSSLAPPQQRKTPTNRQYPKMVQHPYRALQGPIWALYRALFWALFSLCGLPYSALFWQPYSACHPACQFLGWLASSWWLPWQTLAAMPTLPWTAFTPKKLGKTAENRAQRGPKIGPKIGNPKMVIILMIFTNFLSKWAGNTSIG